MAIVWADFPSGQHGLYGTDTDLMLDGIWAQFGTGSLTLTNDPDPNIGSAGRVVKCTSSGSSSAFMRIVNPTGDEATTGIAYRVWQTHLPNGNTFYGNSTLWFATSANVNICYIKILADGSIGAYSAADALLGQSAPCTTADAYHHIEVKVFRDATNGTIEVRVNGVPKLELDTLNLGASDIGMIRLGSFVSTADSFPPDNYYKDFVYWDGNGSHGNDFQGSVAVRDLLPDSDVSLNWTPSTGSTGWDLLDESPANDADYIYAEDPPPAAAEFNVTDLPVDVTSVRALLPIVRSWKTDGGDCNIQMGLSPNGTDWTAGADRPMTTSATYWWDVSHTSPDTLSPWTPSEVNDVIVRVDRTL